MINLQTNAKCTTINILLDIMKKIKSMIMFNLMANNYTIKSYDSRSAPVWVPGTCPSHFGPFATQNPIISIGA